MFTRSFVVLVTSLIFVFGYQMSKAQSADTVSSMFSCLHGLPSPNSDNQENKDENLFECISSINAECRFYEPFDMAGESNNTVEACLLTVVNEIKSTMFTHLEIGWPDKNTVGHYVRRVTMKYAIKRFELECEYSRELSLGAYKPWHGKIDEEDIEFQNALYSQCLFSHLATNYWINVVHDQIR